MIAIAKMMICKSIPHQIEAIFYDMSSQTPTTPTPPQPSKSDITHAELIECIKDIKAVESKFLTKKISIFEAIGFERQEIRHSKLLCYLLAPQNAHSLRDEFFKELLLSATKSLKNHAKHAIRFAIHNFDDLEVQTEWHSIDIYAHSRQHKLVVAIENKIGASEHNDQLQRYSKRLVQTHNKDDYTIIKLYLTPQGDLASAPEEWIPVGYEQVLSSLRAARENRVANLDPDTQTLIEEYINLIERKVLMDNTELEEAFGEIYQKHKKFFNEFIPFVENQEQNSTIANDVFTSFGNLLKQRGVEINQQGRYTKSNWGIVTQGFSINNFEFKSKVQQKWFGKKPQSPIMWAMETQTMENTINSTTILLEINRSWLKEKTDGDPSLNVSFDKLRSEFIEKYGFDGNQDANYSSSRLIQKSIQLPISNTDDYTKIAESIAAGTSDIFNKESLERMFESIKNNLPAIDIP